MRRRFTHKTAAAAFAVAFLAANALAVYYLWYKGPHCDGRCYTINQSFDFQGGSYPRLAQAGDLLLVAYSDGRFVLDGVNLTSGAQIGPRVIIPHGIDAARSTLHYAEALDFVICVYNHDAAASCGIAWAPRGDVLNESSWQRRDNLVGPVFKEFFHVGLWEPYLAPYNDTTFLLYYSNQTIFDPAQPIDASGYYFLLEGYKVVQKIDICWVQWNGTGFTARYCGAASHDIPGGPIHYKDGMASSVAVGENGTCKEYLMTFEQFKPPTYDVNIAMVRIRVSEAGVETLWRRDVPKSSGGAPFIARLGDGTFVTSFRHYYTGDGTNRIAFVAMAADQATSSQPIYLAAGVFGWPSILADSQGRLWLAGELFNPGSVTVMRISMDFNWHW
ncbi:MAG: hypothetical protein JW839_01660 [Candidatus Lokiarchaeota archaeon]|nr:hypothetical protein [Candidatus Lokiarchaeota archaeon]